MGGPNNWRETIDYLIIVLLLDSTRICTLLLLYLECNFLRHLPRPLPFHSLHVLFEQSHELKRVQLEDDLGWSEANDTYQWVWQSAEIYERLIRRFHSRKPANPETCRSLDSSILLNGCLPLLIHMQWEVLGGFLPTCGSFCRPATRHYRDLQCLLLFSAI